MMVDVMPFTEPVSVWRSRGRGRHSHGDGSCWSHGSSQRDTTAGGSTLKMLMSYSVLLCRSVFFSLFLEKMDKNGRWQLLLPVHWSIAWAWPAIQCPGVPFLPWRILGVFAHVENFLDEKSQISISGPGLGAGAMHRAQFHGCHQGVRETCCFTVRGMRFFFSVRLVLSGCRIQITVITVLLQPNSLMMSMSLL